MRESFRRSEEFLYLEPGSKDPVMEQRQNMHEMVQGATPEQLGMMLEVFQRMGACKTGQAS